MIYNLKGHKINISDELLKKFKEEMNNTSQKMLDTCAHLALLKYDDITDDDMFKKRIEDVMYVEMTKHQIERTTKFIEKGQKYNIYGHIIIPLEKMVDLYKKIMSHPLSLSGLKTYVALALEHHKGESFSDEQLSLYAYEECKEEMNMYE